MLKTCKLLLYIAILSALVAATPTTYAASLNITVKTSQPSYARGEDITIQGSLTYNGLPVQYNTVGLQVWNPDSSLVVSRTPQTNAAGGYSVTFSLPSDAKLGTYTVDVSSIYSGETATNSTSFTYTHPSSVGGIYIQIDKFELLAPYVGLASAILVGIVASAAYVKRVKPRKRKQ